MNAPSFEHLEEVAEDEIGTVTPAEWETDPAMMGNVVGGVIAGRLQDEGLRLHGAPEEVAIEASVRVAVLAAMERLTHLGWQRSKTCVDSVIRYLIEPPFNHQEEPQHEPRFAV
jgi:hypothetical protein